MSVCTVLESPTFPTSWTSVPNVPNYQYYTYYDAYDATLSTTLVIPSSVTLIITMLCAVTQPLDFFVSTTIGDQYWGWVVPCPTNASGNISGNLGYFEAGTYPMTMRIEVQADVTESQWLQISDVWMTVCEEPGLLPLLWLLSIPVGALIVFLLYCCANRKADPSQYRYLAI